MFQNISKEYGENQNLYEDVELNKKERIRDFFKKCCSKQMIILYMVSFLLSMVSFKTNKELAPFGIAILVATLANCIPIGIISALVVTGSAIAFGGQGALNVLLILLLVFFSILLKSPKFEEEANEKRKLGFRLFISTFIVQMAQVLFKEVIVYDIMFCIIYSISTYIFYKIFVNSINAVSSIGERKAYSIEEVMGASLIFAIAACSVKDISIFGYSIKNILCILIVLIMGWKNGVLVGATTGITIGSVVGIIGDSEPIIIATYALSGMVAGIFNKLGKIGVIVGFILGNILLSYVSNGNTVQIIAFQEILIAALGLLAVPKEMKINIADLNKQPMLLPETTGRTLEESKEAAFKLNSISETIFEMAKTYKEAAATIVDEEDLKKQEQDNFSIFERELENELDGMEENMLFDDMYNPQDDIIREIFEILLNKEKITRRDLLDTLAEHGNYIVGYEREYITDSVEQDIAQIVKVINYSYKVSKINFIWKKKLDENKKAVSSQLEEVSKAIESLAKEMKNKQEEPYKQEREEIKILMQEKEMPMEDIGVKKEASGRTQVTLYTNPCENVEKPMCNTKKMGKILAKVFNENMVLQKQECSLRENLTQCKYTYLSEDKQSIQIGIAKTTKNGSSISGDTLLQTKLEDAKFLIAISDGMGSGKEAKKASKTAITMLEKLLTSGFEKDTSLRLINSSLATIGKEDMYATLDVAVLDLYAQKLEFIKNGACPTYVKHGRNVEVLKNLSLPTGILTDIDLVVNDKELQEGDILVMCTDGILESSEEYTNKELWLKYMLEDIETEDPQKIADILLNEAIDNNFGIPKDDMSIVVVKINKKKQG